ncbi:Tim17/Tim22/Tim23/Pmp24 family-domain-containing protein [Polychytrium aggregatum]|uniref:Tim17/Tim22/Tim23/Pmp24 family-domain-containing protein n=1 Tax=Polychytrium aggregatum TaxID=110093 RepID=UPI0022FEE3B5|nr:Tim17/Tim22/Tim23/Pmp24 family-domain-containing protein [Polychytrium aggregatum]KAI9201793.1 Tim17/Tim22/Tim23/Pmp24 family-domain-containing protein [Polychytrium aggregatum]
MSWFGFGKTTKQQPEEPVQQAPASAPAPLFAEMQPETIQSMLSTPQGVLDQSKVLPPAPQDEIEYLFIQDNPMIPSTDKPTGTFGPLPMRTWSDKVCYGTGSAYLLGLSSGSVYGAFRGLKTAQGRSFNIRFNNVINTVTRYGPRYGNAMGVLTLSWSLMDTWFGSIRGQSDYYNHIPAAFITGFIFKSTAGLRPAAIMGSLLASVVAGYGALTTLQGSHLYLPQYNPTATA